ncbi:hypothetical protein JHK85_004722 [Glycine max]|nr:hypothetical protein JHK85_004722 [Glycine max]KAG5080479.1 hypothetical protein JHK86_004544 [Glycine max]
MGNKNSALSKAHSSQRPKVASIEPQPNYVVSMQSKLSTKSEVVSLWAYPTEQQGEKEKPELCDDHTFFNYIQRTKYKIKSKSNINGCDAEQRYPAAPADVANGTSIDKENERDPFSDYIQSARKKLRMRTLSRNNSSFRRGFRCG